MRFATATAARGGIGSRRLAGALRSLNGVGRGRLGALGDACSAYEPVTAANSSAWLACMNAAAATITASGPVVGQSTDLANGTLSNCGGIECTVIAGVWQPLSTLPASSYVPFVDSSGRPIVGTAAPPGSPDGMQSTCSYYGGGAPCVVKNGLWDWPVPAATAVTPAVPATPASSCQSGWSLDASGVCTEYTDTQLLAGLNTIEWDGASAIPAEQVNRVDPQILATYKTYTAINPGTVLAYILGLGGAAVQGATTYGSDQQSYTFNNGAWVLTASLASATPVSTTSGTPVTNSTTGYQPSTDDLFVFAAIAASEPYTTAEISFAKTIEAYGSPTSSLFTSAQIASLWNQYAAAGYSTTAVTQALDASTGVNTQVASGTAVGANLPAGSFSTSYAGYGIYLASTGQLYSINSDGSATALGGFSPSQITAAQQQAATTGITMTGNVTTDAGGDVLFSSAVIGAIETALGVSAGLSSNTLLLVGGGLLAAFLLFGRK